LIGIEIMKKTELASKDLVALNAELTELLKTSFKLRMQKGTQQLTNTSQLGRLSVKLLAQRRLLLKKLHRNKEKGI